MSDEEPKMLVSKIKEGVVIDKIPAGKALSLMSILHIEEDADETIAIAIRVDSSQLGTKDIVKITDRELTDDELRAIWLVVPNAKVSVIENYEVTDQFLLSERLFEDEFSGVLKCNNPTCATNYREPVDPRFRLMQRSPLLVRCLYCDRVMLEENVREQL